MTPAEFCDDCGRCRSWPECQRRSGLKPEAAAQLPPPALRQRQGANALFDALAILILFGLPVGCLHMAGAL